MITRAVVYGYRVMEVALALPTEIKNNLVIRIKRAVVDRRVKAVSLLHYFTGCIRPQPDLDDPINKATGCFKRVGKKPAGASRKVQRALQRFTRRWVRRFLRPLARDSDTSVETWLEGCKYTQRRKEQLRNVHYRNRMAYNHKKVTQVKGFLKDEGYDVFKHPRWIMSRSDEFKCLYGPIVKLMENAVYGMENSPFIKHVPVAQRPDYVMKHLHSPGSHYYVSDYTAFESHFTPDVMAMLEFELYSWMTSELPEHDDFMKLCFEVVGGKNSVTSKHACFKVHARMSGEMSTSLGNGFSNLMLMLFTCERVGCKNVRGIVEGDDGLFAFDGPIPTKELFAEAGFDIKIDVYERLSDASFCGMVFDEDDRVIITEPWKVMADFGWTSRQYLAASSVTLKALQRSKSLSLAIQYRGCPIVGTLAQLGLRLTADVSDRAMRKTIARQKMSGYEKDRLFLNLEGKFSYLEPPSATRSLFAARYGIPVALQIQMEDHLRIQEGGVMDLGPMDYLVPSEYYEMYKRFFIDIPHLAGRPPLPDEYDQDRLRTVLSMLERYSGGRKRTRPAKA